MNVAVKDEPKVKCPYCGNSNRLGVAFCTSCGERVYADNAKLPKVTVKTKGGLKRAVRNGVLACLLLFFLGSAGLVFWPFPPLSRASLSSTDTSVKNFIKNATASLDSGIPVPIVILEEGQLNRYVINQSGESTERELSVYLGSGKVVMIADEDVGPFTISTRLVLEKKGEDGSLGTDSLWVGHLPLPPFMAAPWTKSLARRYDLELDNRLWDEVKLFRSDTGQLFIGVPAEGN